MREPYNVTKEWTLFDKTISLNKLIGKRVLSKGGKVIGRVSQIRIGPADLELKGILVSRIIGRPIYIGRGYFSRLSEEAVILNIEVSVLIKNKYVVDSKGKILGRVKKVVRDGNRNDVEGLYVKSLFSREFFIPKSGIEYVNKSVVLKSNYNAAKKYFWQRAK